MLRGGSDLAKRDLPPELSAALRLAWALAARLGVSRQAVSKWETGVSLR